MQFCMWTPPTAETFRCFISRIVRRLRKKTNLVDSKQNLFYPICIRHSVSHGPCIDRLQVYQSVSTDAYVTELCTSVIRAFYILALGVLSSNSGVTGKQVVKRRISVENKHLKKRIEAKMAAGGEMWNICIHQHCRFLLHWLLGLYMMIQ